MGRPKGSKNKEYYPTTCHPEEKHYAKGLCKKCYKLRDYREKYHLVVKHRRKTKYGLDEQSFQKMMLNQNGQCLICKKTMEPPAVDHDHDTGRVRGLLCKQCNVGLGSFGDNADNLFSAMVYLKENAL